MAHQVCIAAQWEFLMVIDDEWDTVHLIAVISNFRFVIWIQPPAIQSVNLLGNVLFIIYLSINNYILLTLNIYYFKFLVWDLF